MQICIYGAGAIGGYMGVLLARAGAEVSLVARGAHLAAMQRSGIKLLCKDVEHVVRLRCTDDPAELGLQDLVIIALKAHSISAAVPAMRPLIGNDTAILTAVNGIPYWYFHGHGGAWQDSIVESVDPDGVQWRLLGPSRAIGCVVYPAAEVVAPGVIQHVYGNKLPIGEPDGTVSPRIRKLAEIMTAAGFEAPIRERIRSGASTGRRASAHIRPRCCRISSAAGRWRSMRWSPRSRSSDAASRWRRRPSIPFWP